MVEPLHLPQGPASLPTPAGMVTISGVWIWLWPDFEAPAAAGFLYYFDIFSGCL